MSHEVRYEKWLLAFILGIGFAVRVIGINFGLPQLYHADEPIVVNHALAYGTGDLNPHFFKIPPFTSYLLFFCYGLYYVISRALGTVESPEAFASQLLIDPTAFYLIGRLVFGVLLGTLTVYALYRLIRKYFDAERALISSFFLATCFLHVRDSHYIYPDIPLILVIVLAFFPMFGLMKHGTRRLYLLGGFVIGIAMAAKYNGIFLFIPFLFAHFVASRKSREPFILNLDFFLSGVAAIVGFVLFNPFAVLDYGGFLSEATNQAGSHGAHGFLYHIVYSLKGAVGIPLLLCALMGIILGLLSNIGRNGRICFLLFVFAYYIVLCYLSQPFGRYVLPLIPFILFFAADGLVSLTRPLTRSRWMVLSFLCLGLTFSSLAKVWRSNQLFMRHDIRSTALNWIEENIPPGSRIAMGEQLYLPSLKMSEAQLLEKKQDFMNLAKEGLEKSKQLRLQLLLEAAKADPELRYTLYFLKIDLNVSIYTFSRPAIRYEESELRRHGIEYIILSRYPGSNDDEFLREGGVDFTTIARFNPFVKKMPSAIDKYAVTGAPFLWQDLFSRAQNGYPIEIIQRDVQREEVSG